MIVVHKSNEAAIEALVIRDVRVRGVDANDLADQLRERTLLFYEVVKGFACANYVRKLTLFRQRQSRPKVAHAVGERS